MSLDGSNPVKTNYDKVLEELDRVHQGGVLEDKPVQQVNCLAQTKSFLTTNQWFLTALAVVGVVGLAVGLTGATGFFANQNMLHEWLGELNFLGNVGNSGAGAMAVVGTIMTAGGIYGVVMLVRKFCDNLKQRREEHKELEEARILADRVDQARDLEKELDAANRKLAAEQKKHAEEQRQQAEEAKHKQTLMYRFFGV